jgi:hypothetical protein
LQDEENQKFPKAPKEDRYGSTKEAAGKYKNRKMDEEAKK